MELTYIKVFVDWLDALEEYGDAERGRLFTALLEYSKTGEAKRLSGNERFIFPMMRNAVDRQRAEYEKTRSKNAENGKKGGRPPKTRETEKSQKNPKNPVVFSKPTESQEKEKEKEEEKENTYRTSNEVLSCQQSVATQRQRIDYHAVLDDYNRTCVNLPQVKVLSDKRKAAIRARLKQYTQADLHMIFVKAQASAFLCGANNRNWSADFDWLLRDANAAKVIDGKYDNREENGNGIADKPERFTEYEI